MKIDVTYIKHRIDFSMEEGGIRFNGSLDFENKGGKSLNGDLIMEETNSPIGSMSLTATPDGEYQQNISINSGSSAFAPAFTGLVQQVADAFIADELNRKKEEQSEAKEEKPEAAPAKEKKSEQKTTKKPSKK